MRPRALYSSGTMVMLSAHTTLELGGPAQTFIEAKDREAILGALHLAKDRPLFVLGGGSNVVVSDAGFEGVVLALRTRGQRLEHHGKEALLCAEAGEPWDALVAQTVAQELAGLECLSGIPGLVGATPIQNVGAYGQEVAERIRAVEVLERETGEVRTLCPEDCDFGYRDSALKRAPERFIVLSVRFALVPGGAPTVRYPELARALPERPSLAQTREAVLALRRRKSMVLDPEDPNRRSAGSFFMNPIVPEAKAQDLVKADPSVPCFPAGPGLTKLSAAWLIERAGFEKGHIEGQVGLSTKHALALINRGGGSAKALLTLAARIVEAVRARFGITLKMEPVLVGERAHVEALAHLKG